MAYHCGIFIQAILLKYSILKNKAIFSAIWEFKFLSLSYDCLFYIRMIFK